jgi:hypothetical protein
MEFFHTKFNECTRHGCEDKFSTGCNDRLRSRKTACMSYFELIRRYVLYHIHIGGK